MQSGNGTTKIQRITMNYFENLNSSKLDNILVSTFLDICNLSQLNWDNTKNLNISNNKEELSDPLYRTVQIYSRILPDA